MPVLCLNPTQKAQIAQMYQNKEKTQRELSKYFNTSERTINRVLQEYQLAAPVPRLQGEAYWVMKLLEEFQIEPSKLRKRLEHPLLTLENIHHFLSACSDEVIVLLLAQIAQRKKQKNKNEESQTV